MAGLRGVAVAAFLLCALAGAWAWCWLLLLGAAPAAIDLLISAAPAALSLGMAFTPTVDRHQYVARLMACCLMLPILLMFWVSSQDAAPGAAAAWPALTWLHKPWLYFTVWPVVQVLAFLLALWWLAAAATRVEPGIGVTQLSAAQLDQHLQALCAASLPVDLTPGDQAHQWQLNIRLPAAEGRMHRVVLDIDDATAQVWVRERLGLSRAAPRNEQEASMRSLGDSPFDPSRPHAQAMSGRSIQTTLIVPDQLAAVELGWAGGQVQLLSPAPTEPEAIVTVLCALVTRCGYAWQPVMGRLV